MNKWLPFVYQYSISILFFLLIIYLTIKYRVINIKSKKHIQILIELFAGLIFFMILHGSLIVLAGVKF